MSVVNLRLLSACGGQLLGGLVHEHLDAGPYRNLGDACTHLPGTDHAYSFNGIAHC
jgi:hypothetical protein